MFRKATLALGLLVALSSAALAGPQYIDKTGFAVSGYDVVSYFDLKQAPVGGQQPTPLAGQVQFTATHNGATFAFATAANRDRFIANPGAYVPQYNGHCAYGVAKGGKVPGNPTLWRIVDGKLYLNITTAVVGFWEEDIPGNLKTSEKNWVSIEPTPASDSVIPDFMSSAPAKN